MVCERVCRKPAGQKQDDAGEEACLSDTEQDPQCVEARCVVDQCGTRRDKPPGDHDAAHPDTRTEPVHQQVAGHFEHGIADEEDAGAEGERRIAQARVGLQHVLRKADVGAIDKSQYVHQHEERQQSRACLRDGALERHAACRVH
jgi:hypothetical protein